MQAQLDAQTASYRLAHKCEDITVRPLNTCQRVYATNIPRTPEIVMRWVHECGCEYARHGWDGVGGDYVDVREGV